ncbi:MAG: selenide, water dikinase SelD [Spirochaetales bacterium]|nr:selenide, water dikinase SelD [Spirochaetales bacterium]
MKNGLFHFSTFCGCAAKLNSGELQSILKKLPHPSHRDVLVGFNTHDDAGVYKVSTHMAIVSTVDINTPMVNDGYVFGQIAAANSISDIYAMGARPITCLNIAGFPEELDKNIIEEIFKGAMSKIAEAGIQFIGGHTIKNGQPVYGLAVNGIIDPDKIWKNDGAESKDVLILTKPVGAGVLFSARKMNVLEEKDIEECIQSAVLLNKSAYEVFTHYTIHGATDITGFGLLGHMYEMASAANKTFIVNHTSVPVFKQSVDMYKKGIKTSITSANLDGVKEYTKITAVIDESFMKVMADPQTNGGLLVSLPKAEAEDCIRDLHSRDLKRAAIIGYVDDFTDKNLIIT